MADQKFRHEYKYLISDTQVAILRARADSIMQKDPHVNHDGTGIYNIRSAYFDDIENTAYWDIENGVDPREKFRIRIYDHSDARIYLELKKKTNNMNKKARCLLTEEQSRILLSAGTLPPSSEYSPILQKMLLQIRTRGLHPVVITEYERIPYIFPIGNVRVTLDLNTRSSCQFDRFFQKNLLFRPIFRTGQQILEIKWDELLPDLIYNAMMLDKLQWTSFSKFYYCRRFLTDQAKSL